MTRSLFDCWKDDGQLVTFPDPAACAARSTRFERMVRRRNIIEGAAGLLLLPLFGAGTLAAASIGEWAFALAGLLVIAGILAILWKLHKSGSNLPRQPEIDCRAYLAAQLVRQRDLLRAVPQWYLAPLVPGIVAIYAITATKVAEFRGWELAIEGIWMPFVATAGFFAFVGWLNLAAARKLDRELDVLMKGER